VLKDKLAWEKVLMAVQFEENKNFLKIMSHVLLFICLN